MTGSGNVGISNGSTTQMIKNDRIIKSLIHGDTIEKLIKENGINANEAKVLISEMSFREYCKLDEASADITPPSGNKISAGPGQTPGAPATPTTPGQQSRPAATTPQNTNTPGDPRGVQVKNPQTGKMEWMKPTAPAGADQAVAEDRELSRMKQLAGIKEDSSSGGTSAGTIAVAPMPMGKMARRRPTNEQPKEYEPKVAKTVVGDTKPNQATGLLSANLAAKNKPAAGRTNNGFKK